MLTFLTFFFKFCLWGFFKANPLILIWFLQSLIFGSNFILDPKSTKDLSAHTAWGRIWNVVKSEGNLQLCGVENKGHGPHLWILLQQFSTATNESFLLCFVLPIEPPCILANWPGERARHNSSQPALHPRLLFSVEKKCNQQSCSSQWLWSKAQSTAIVFLKRKFHRYLQLQERTIFTELPSEQELTSSAFQVHCIVRT